MSTLILWSQPWGPEAESTLLQALEALGCSMSELSSQKWDSRTSSIGGIRDVKTSYLAPASDTWSSAMLHLGSMLGDPLAAELSRITDNLAIAIFEYDQETWGYRLFDHGTLMDLFWSNPEAVDESPEDYAGIPEIVSGEFCVPLETVAPYICHVSEANEEVKAFEDDEHTLNDHWVRVDFLRRLGLTYPEPGKVAGGRYVKIDEPGL